MPDLPFTSRCFRLALLLLILFTLAPLSSAAELRDPTRPPAVSSYAPSPAATPAGEPLALLGTLVSQGRRIAIIDGQAIAEGGSINGAQVVRVGAGEAVVRQNGREHTLRIAAPQQKGFRKSAREDQP